MCAGADALRHLSRGREATTATEFLVAVNDVPDRGVNSRRQTALKTISELAITGRCPRSLSLPVWHLPPHLTRIVEKGLLPFST